MGIIGIVHNTRYTAYTEGYLLQYKTVEANRLGKAVVGVVIIYRVMKALIVLPAGILDFSSLVTAYYAIDDIPQAMLDMKTKNDNRIKFMIRMGD